MSGHTPGPWVVTDSTQYGTAPHQRRWTVTAHDPERLSSGYRVQVVSLMGDAPRGEADADLIAAAPDLLAACEFAVAAMDSWRDPLTNPLQRAVDQKRAEEKIRAAIAKARGGE